jgi:hypothetical protein
MSDPLPDTDTVPFIAHDEFRSGLPHGRFRIVVNPVLARRFVVQRTRIDLLALMLIGAGAMLALSGWSWTGVALVALGITANRLVRRQAARILLHLAASDAAVYAEAATQGVLEVRRGA